MLYMGYYDFLTDNLCWEHSTNLSNSPRILGRTAHRLRRNVTCSVLL